MCLFVCLFVCFASLCFRAAHRYSESVTQLEAKHIELHSLIRVRLSLWAPPARLVGIPTSAAQMCCSDSFRARLWARPHEPPPLLAAVAIRSAADLTVRCRIAVLTKEGVEPTAPRPGAYC